MRGGAIRDGVDRNRREFGAGTRDGATDCGALARQHGDPRVPGSRQSRGGTARHRGDLGQHPRRRPAARRVVDGVGPRVRSALPRERREADRRAYLQRGRLGRRGPDRRRHRPCLRDQSPRSLPAYPVTARRTGADRAGALGLQRHARAPRPEADLAGRRGAGAGVFGGGDSAPLLVLETLQSLLHLRARPAIGEAWNRHRGGGLQSRPHDGDRFRDHAAPGRGGDETRVRIAGRARSTRRVPRWPRSPKARMPGSPVAISIEVRRRPRSRPSSHATGRTRSTSGSSASG